MGSHGSPSMTGCSGDPSDSRSCRISTFLVSIQGRTSAWLLSACFPALLWTSSAPAACCQLRTTCALPGTEGRVVQIMVSMHWCWNVLVDKGLAEPSLLIASICLPFTPCLEPPTPHYNTWILQDTALEAHMHLLSSVLGSAHGLKDGVALLKVWLRQRELDKVSCGGGLVSWPHP